MIKVKNLREAATYLPLLSEALCSYSYPHVNADVEEMYLPYKTWGFTIDGYDVCVHMNEFLVNDSVIQNLQVFPRRLYSIPFHVSFKIAVAFLGKKDLVSFNLIRHGHVVNCWTRLKDNGEGATVSVKNTVQTDSYLGINYGVLE